MKPWKVRLWDRMAGMGEDAGLSPTFAERLDCYQSVQRPSSMRPGSSRKEPGFHTEVWVQVQTPLGTGSVSLWYVLNL